MLEVSKWGRSFTQLDAGRMRWWPVSTHRTRPIRHPRIGEIDVEWDAYPLRGTPGPMMIVFVPRPGRGDRPTELFGTITVGPTAPDR